MLYYARSLTARACLALDCFQRKTPGTRATIEFGVPPDSVDICEVVHLFQIAVQALECPRQRALGLQRHLSGKPLSAGPPRVQPQHGQDVVDLPFDAQHRIGVHRRRHRCLIRRRRVVCTLCTTCGLAGTQGTRQHTTVAQVVQLMFSFGKEPHTSASFSIANSLPQGDHLAFRPLHNCLHCRS